MHPQDVNVVSLTATSSVSEGTASKDLAELYRLHAGGVYTLARRLCGDEAEAEDVLQETFLEAQRSLARYRGEGAIAGWLKRICASKAFMRMRRRRLFSVESAQESGEPVPLDARLDLEPALERLSPVTRAVVWLHDVEGCTHQEIAALTEQTESFSKSQLSRGHARLRAWLRPEDGGAIR